MNKYNQKSKENQALKMDKYDSSKKKSRVLAKMIVRFVSETSLEIIQQCNNFMMFASDIELKNKKQFKGSSCKNRFCPLCSWKKARKDALALSVQMEYIKQEHKKEFIFVTLTAPNVESDELENEIKLYNQAFKKMMERKEVDKISKGYVRKLEITYDKEPFITREMYWKRKEYYDVRNLTIGNENPNFDTYHPHFHVMIAVNKSYFRDTDYYIKRDRWLELWQLSTDNPLITQVDVRKVRHNDNKEVAEIAKYAAKDSDYLISDEVFSVFYKALKGKRLITHSGLFKESMNLWKNGKLDKYLEKDTTEYVYALLYSWGMQKYVLEEQRELTESERELLNKQFVDEKDID